MAGLENIYDALSKEKVANRQTGIDYSQIREGGVAAAVMAQAGGMLAGAGMEVAGYRTPAQMKQQAREEVKAMFPNPTTYSDMIGMANAFKNLDQMDDYETIMKMAEDMKPTGVKQSAFGEKLAFIKAKKDAGEPLTDVEKKILGGGTTVNVGAGDTAYGKEIGKISAEEDHALVKFARRGAVKGLEKTDRVLNILDSGGASTGMLAELDLVKNRFLGIFGNQEAIDSATKTQVLEAFLGSDVFPMISALGIGARGLDTPAEREFLISVMTGRKEMTPDAIRELTDLRRRLNYNIINEYNDRLADGHLDRYQDERGITLKPVKVSYRPPYNSKPGNIQGTRVFKLITGEYVDVYGKPFKLKKGK